MAAACGSKEASVIKPPVINNGNNEGQEHNVEAVLHMYPTDGHGWGFNPTPFHHLWISQLEQWLKD